MLGNTEIKAFPQLELVSPCYPHCHAVSPRAIGEEEGRMQAGREPRTAAPSRSDSEHEATCCTASLGKELLPGFWSLLPRLTSFGSYEEWPHLAKDHSDWDASQPAAQGRGWGSARQLPTSYTELYGLLYIKKFSCFNDISQHATHKPALALSAAGNWSSPRLKSEAARSFKMEAGRCPASIFFQVTQHHVALNQNIPPHICLQRKQGRPAHTRD